MPLLAVSYRDDEVAASHPLRRVIGELPSALVTRIDRAAPVTDGGGAARAQRCRAHRRAFTPRHKAMPFFVTELLRHREDEVPRSVQDLVLARFARLIKAGTGHRAAWLQSCRRESSAGWWTTLLAPPLADLEACLDSGLLLDDASSLSFRHELARVAVESSLASLLAQALHAQSAGRDHSPATATFAPARLVHHAAHADDVRGCVPIRAGRRRSRRASAALIGRRPRTGAPRWPTPTRSTMRHAHAGLMPTPPRSRSLAGRARRSTRARSSAQLLHRLGETTREAAESLASGQPVYRGSAQRRGRRHEPAAPSRLLRSAAGGRRSRQRLRRRGVAAHAEPRLRGQCGNRRARRWRWRRTLNDPRY